jgi:CRP/FNR family transcriptional regulator, cyclic AMP receptor protein
MAMAAVITKGEEMKIVQLFRGMNEVEIEEVAALCKERKYAVGEFTQKEGENSSEVHFIVSGRVGTVVRIPNINYTSNEIMLDTLTAGDSFGWSSLIKGTPWSTLKAIEPTTVMYAKSEDLIKLCEKNNHIGFLLMKNLASLISSRLRRNRMSTLNALVAIKGEA